MQSHELVKLYYRIGEVSEIVGVQPHVLRYWETEFRSIRPQKSSKGQRVYSRRDVEKLLRVKDLLKNQGFTIAGARKRLSEATDAVAIAPAPAAVLEEPSTERNAKDMRKELLGLREELVRMLDEISALKGD
jgi:DNA-binding transcriptional MerR regulator